MDLVGAVKLANDKTGWKLATSVGGIGTGERCDAILIDDPHNVKEAESEARIQEAVDLRALRCRALRRGLGWVCAAVAAPRISAVTFAWSPPQARRPR
jgi:hypothetical protein